MLKGYTDKLVFSFVDVKTYRKVQNNLNKETGLYTRETVENAVPSHSQIDELVDGLTKCRDAWHQQCWNVQLATCGEKIDLDKYSIEHNRCIDVNLTCLAIFQSFLKSVRI